MIKREIKFSPPDITDEEINEVVDTLKSGWITTGPKTKQFEKNISEYVGTKKTVCVNSATMGMEMVLRILGVGQGDEVITCAYTYTSSASVIDHVGAKIVFADCNKDNCLIDYEDLESKITEKTKVIIPIHLGGVMVDNNKILEIVERKKHLFKPNNDLQKKFGRIILLSDAAHSFGASLNGIKSGSDSDFTVFSFHAVKNLTTAEGGAITWTEKEYINSDDLYSQFMLLALHGQNKDALAKTNLGGWEYDIKYPGYKGNMTDIMASIGLVQLRRYPQLLEERRKIYEYYLKRLSSIKRVKVYRHLSEVMESSLHLLILNIEGITIEDRNNIIIKLAERGISSNVHYKPLPMMTAYKNLGFDIKDYPNSFNNYKTEITLPFHTLLTEEDTQYIMDNFIEILKEYGVE